MPKVLLAEDDRTMVALLTTLLKMEGYEVVALDVHQDVASAVTQEKPDFLLMDVHLGGQSGMDIVEAIRKNPSNSGVNIVMTSGLDMRDECLRRGADHFLLKPFMPDDLLNLLKN
ncbi:MAG: response regulator [Chloroflexota bacterium]|nr:response regulator [Chloroflexota bacterium]MBI5704453.1 response regulator [Chloroflexota bacterium]